MTLHIPLQAKTKKMLLAENHREISIGFFILLALIVSFIFPNTSYGESFWLSFFFLFLFPILAIKYILKEPLGIFGFSKGNSRQGIILSIVFVALFILLNYFIVSRPEFQNKISINPGIISSYWRFLLFELFVILPLHFFWEFFFRGFLQLGLESKLGKYSLLLQAILQSLLFLRGSWLMISLVFASALSAGFIAQKSRSIYYSFASMWIISISLDIMIIRIIHQAVT